MKPEELSKALKVAAEDIKAPKDALEPIGAEIEGAAKQRAPVRTGALRDDITARVIGAEVHIGNTLPYAPPVHDGTRYMVGRPYLTEGWEDAMPAIGGILEDWGDKILEKVANG